MKKTKERQACETCGHRNSNGTCKYSPYQRTHKDDWCSGWKAKK